MWHYNYEAACLCHSAKGSTWKKHKYIAIRNGKYIYPGDNTIGSRPASHGKNVGEGTVSVKRRGRMPITILDKYDGIKKPLATPHGRRETAVEVLLGDKWVTLHENHMPMPFDKTAKSAKAGYKTTSPVQSEANRKAKAAKLRKESVERAKKNAAAITAEKDRAKVAKRRRKDTVMKATFAGIVQTEKQRKDQREWRRNKRKADKRNAERKRLEETRKFLDDFEKREEARKKRMQSAKRAWNKFKDITFDTGRRRTEK